MMLDELTEKQVSTYVDERGKVWDFASFPMEALHVVTMEPCAVRGNHTHDKDEIICVIGSKSTCEIDTLDDISGKEEKTIVQSDVQIYKVKAGVRHWVKNIGTDTFYLMVFLVNDGCNTE